MSSIEVELCYAILEDHFGYYVAIVGNLLLSNKFSLPLIIRSINPKLSTKEIKRSLVILEHHNMLEYQYSPRGILYSLSSVNVLRLIRVPRAILIVKTLYGNIGETIFEEIFSLGKLSCSDCLRRVSSRLGIDIKEAQKKFSNLVDAQMIIRSPMLKADDAGFPIFEDLTCAFLMPDKVLDAEKEETLTKLNSAPRKRNLTEPKMDSDSKILWHVNWPRMERFLRDELILEAISENEMFDKTFIQIVRLLIKVGEVKSDIYALQSQPITLQDVFRYAKDNKLNNLTRELINDKLIILSSETNEIIRKIGDSGGGLYVINYEKAIESLCHAHIESAIREKLDDNSVRIFRLLCKKGFLEEDQIEKFAMLSAKEAKQVCYTLLDNNYITTRQIARTNDFAPARTFYLYGVLLPPILGSMIMFTSKAIRNAIIRRNRETITYTALLDRQLKMETIIANIECDPNLDEESKKQQVTEVEEVYMTVGDKAEIAKYKAGQQSLWSIEIELERVLFIFQQYQRFRRTVSLEQMKQRKTRRKPKSILDSFA